VSFNFIAKAFVLPPGCFFVILVVAFFCRRRLPRGSLLLAIMAVIGMYLMSTTWFEHRLVNLVAVDTPCDLAALQAKKSAMIVVLAASRYERGPEYEGQDRVGLNTLGRLRYGVYLHHKTGLPLLVSGGSVFGEREPLADLMKQSLVEFFCLDPTLIYVENKSRNTHENAIFTKRILDDLQVRTAVLVTGSLHMKRAWSAFERAGVDVIPAPTHFIRPGRQSRGLGAWLPRNRMVSYDAVHELIGRLWYRLRYGDKE